MAGSQIPPNPGVPSRPMPGSYPVISPPMPGPDSHRDSPPWQPGIPDGGPVPRPMPAMPGPQGPGGGIPQPNNGYPAVNPTQPLPR